jgi:hypothetical protein
MRMIENVVAHLARRNRRWRQHDRCTRREQADWLQRCLERRYSCHDAWRTCRRGLSLATSSEARAGNWSRSNCSECHAVGEADASPHEAAPPFRKLSEMFPMDALEEAFSDGRIYSGHPGHAGIHRDARTGGCHHRLYRVVAGLIRHAPLLATPLSAGWRSGPFRLRSG